MSDKLSMNLTKFGGEPDPTPSLPDLNPQTTQDQNLQAQLKTYYEKKLLENAKPELIHNQFGDKYPIPKSGGKTIQWRKFTPLAKALTPDGNSMEVTSITATVGQYGDYITQSDLLELTAIDNTILQATKLLGAQAGETIDTLTREVLHGGTNVLYAPTMVDGVAQPSTSRDDLDNTALLTLQLILDAVAKLRAKNVKPIDDAYVAIVHPYVEAQLIGSQGFIDVTQYGRPESIYSGEIGKLAAVRFVRSSEAKIIKHTVTSGGTSKDYYIFLTLFLGKGGYGVTEIEGGGLEHIVKQRGFGDDPLNQRSAVGWKATHVAQRLNEKAILRLEHCLAHQTGLVAN